MKLGNEDLLFSKLTTLFLLHTKSTSPSSTGFSLQSVPVEYLSQTSGSSVSPLPTKGSQFLQMQTSAKSERTTPTGHSTNSPLPSLNPTSSQITSSTTSISVVRPTNEAPLSYTIEKLLEKLPAGWKKVTVTANIKSYINNSFTLHIALHIDIHSL